MSTLVKAIQIEENGGPEVLKLVEIEVPAPGENEITIRQHAAGLNFIDIYFRTGLYKSAMPTGLGFEGAGEVIAVGRAQGRKILLRRILGGCLPPSACGLTPRGYLGKGDRGNRVSACGIGVLGVTD